jgi:hypothetical protein
MEENPAVELTISVRQDVDGALPGGRSVLAKAMPSIQGLDEATIDQIAASVGNAARAVLSMPPADV